MRSPNWLESELMIALDLYLNKDLNWFNRMSDSTFEIVALSEILNSLDLHKEKPNNFRSTGSIRMKLANFMSLDDRYGKKSLSNAGGMDKKIWNEYCKNPQELHNECIQIINNHLIKKNDIITEYLNGMPLNDQYVIEKDFSKFSASLNRTLSYFEKVANENPENVYSTNVINSCKKIRKTLEWTKGVNEIVFQYDIEYKEHAGINLKPVKNRKQKRKSEKDQEINTTEEKIGKYIQRSFLELVEQDKVTEEIIEKLKTHKYSKDFFGIKPSFLIEIDENNNIKEQITDENGYVRYWTKPVEIHGRKYCICKEWFENQRERYQRWFNTVNIPLFYMLKPKELKRILEYLKENDSKKVNITKQEIIKEFPTETTEEVLKILVEKGVLSSFQGSSREFVIDDYDALYRMLNNPSDYAGGKQ